MTAIAQRAKGISGEGRRTIVAGIFVAIFVVVVCWVSWAGNPITFNSLTSG